LVLDLFRVDFRFMWGYALSGLFWLVEGLLRGALVFVGGWFGVD
jgi:hypothetical protein